MARTRPVFHPEIGTIYKNARDARGWSQSQVADMALRRKLPVTLQTLRYIEEGKTKNPSADALRALANLYGSIDYEQVIERLLHATYGVTSRVRADSDALPTPDLPPAKGPTMAALEQASTDRDVPDFRRVAVMKSPIAAGKPLIVEEDEIGDYVAFTSRFLRQFSDPICLRVGKNQESMTGAGIRPGDLVLIDRDLQRRLRISETAIYAVNVPGFDGQHGGTLKRLKVVGSPRGGPKFLLLLSDNPDKATYPTVSLELEDNQSILDLVVGEVVWHGQYIGGVRGKR